jgi:hypothetical protein
MSQWILKVNISLTVIICRKITTDCTPLSCIVSIADNVVPIAGYITKLMSIFNSSQLTKRTVAFVEIKRELSVEDNDV